MRKSLIIVVMFGAALAGCGGGSDDVDVASQAKKGDDASASADGTDTTDPGDPKFTGKGGKDFCEYLRELEENEDDLSLGSGGDTKENRDKAEKALDIFDELDDKAPAEIDDDVKLVTKQLRPIFQAVAKGEDATAVATSVQPTEAESKAFTEASGRVEAYSRNVCGIDDSSSQDQPPADGGTDGGSTDEQAPADEGTPPEG